MAAAILYCIMGSKQLYEKFSNCRLFYWNKMSKLSVLQIKLSCWVVSSPIFPCCCLFVRKLMSPTPPYQCMDLWKDLCFYIYIFDTDSSSIISSWKLSQMGEISLTFSPRKVLLPRRVWQYQFYIFYTRYQKCSYDGHILLWLGLVPKT